MSCSICLDNQNFPDNLSPPPMGIPLPTPPHLQSPLVELNPFITREDEFGYFRIYHKPPPTECSNNPPPDHNGFPESDEVSRAIQKTLLLDYKCHSHSWQACQTWWACSWIPPLASLSVSFIQELAKNSLQMSNALLMMSFSMRNLRLKTSKVPTSPMNCRS